MSTWDMNGCNRENRKLCGAAEIRPYAEFCIVADRGSSVSSSDSGRRWVMRRGVGLAAPDSRLESEIEVKCESACQHRGKQRQPKAMRGSRRQ